MSNSPPDPPAFDPVPSASKRHDGWTPERQRGSIAMLARIGIGVGGGGGGDEPEVGLRASEAGRAGQRLRPRLARSSGDGRVSAVFTGVDRALNGVEVPYFYGGLQRGTRRVYNDRLLAAALRAIGRAQLGEW